MMYKLMGAPGTFCGSATHNAKPMKSHGPCQACGELTAPKTKGSLMAAPYMSHTKQFIKKTHAGMGLKSPRSPAFSAICHHPRRGP
jgi:hypothetical protein